MLNVTINISTFTTPQGTITSQKCTEWCTQQHYSANYLGFTTIMIINIVMLGAFLMIYNNSDMLMQRTRLTEDRISQILNSIVLFCFSINTLYMLYWVIFK